MLREKLCLAHPRFHPAVLTFARMSWTIRCLPPSFPIPNSMLDVTKTRRSSILDDNDVSLASPFANGPNWNLEFASCCRDSQFSHHISPFDPAVGVHDLDLRTWVERQSVFPQNGLSTPKREEFFQSDRAGLRDVVHGVGVRKER